MLNKKVGLIAVFASFAAAQLMAGTIASYASGDVLVCFRKGSVDMVVDAGSITSLSNAAPNQRIPITQYTGTQLADVGTNGVSWSAFTWLSDNTLFVTRPRTSVNQQTAPWTESGSQSGSVQRMETIPPGALDELNLLVYPESTASAVVEEDDSDDNANYTDGASYHSALAGAYGSDFDGKFEGNPENTTANNFTTKATVVRSDFYQLTPVGGPSSPSGKWMGYFELNTNGAMTYVAYPSTSAVFSTVTHTNSQTTIYYTAGLYGTYTLRATNVLTGTAMSNWPAITTLASGDTATHSTAFTDTNSVRFYTITAQ
jgi:hypothetical protein